MKDIEILDQTDTEDAVINGVIHFKSTKNDYDKMLIIQDAIKKINEVYNTIFKSFDVEISLNDVNFIDGWIDYSIEGKEDINAFGYWCKSNKIQLPCPEYP